MGWKRVCATEDVAENTLKKFEVDGVALVVANHGSGFTAFPPFCPHMEEPLAESGMLEGGVMTCSKHLWQWDLKSGDKVGMAEKDLLIYETRLEGSDVMANIEQELAYDYDIEDDMDDDDFFGAD